MNFDIFDRKVKVPLWEDPIIPLQIQNMDLRYNVGLYTNIVYKDAVGSVGLKVHCS